MQKAEMQRHIDFLTKQLAANAAKPDSTTSAQHLLDMAKDKHDAQGRILNQTTQAVAAATQAAHQAAERQAAFAAAAQQKLADTIAASNAAQTKAFLSLSHGSRAAYRALPRRYSDDDDFEDEEVRYRRKKRDPKKAGRKKSSSAARHRSGDSPSDDEYSPKPRAIKHVPNAQFAQPAQPAQPAQQPQSMEQMMAMLMELQRNTNEQLKQMVARLPQNKN